ncbi:MAG: SDR family oxidoreductase [Pseudohongiellaceae bacterium]
MTAIMITGANRGIGLEFVRQYLAQGETVLATCRNPEAAEQLHALDCENLSIARLDVGKQESINNFCNTLESGTISTFISNAGIYGPKTTSLGAVDAQTWSEVIGINSIAPLMLTQSLLPGLAPNTGCKLIYISSKMGSIAENTSGGSYIYRSSKTALNQVVKSLALDLASVGHIVAALHPGWVKTQMGGPNALIDVQTSVSGLISVISGLTHKGSGKFYDYQGESIPW